VSFCTVVNCMDGRVQLPVNAYLREHFGVAYVDTVTEPGPNGILAAGTDSDRIESILHRIRLSIEHHQSVGLAVAGHHDCAGNPVPKAEQIDDTRAAIDLLHQRFPDLPMVGLWVDENGQVQPLE